MANFINEEKLIELFNNDVLIIDIAKQLGCSRDTITRRLQKLGLKSGTSYKPKTLKKDPLFEKKQEIKELYLFGKTCKEIGKIVGLCEKTIGYHLKNMGVKIRSQKKIDQTKFEELWNQGKSDKEIADFLE